MITDLKVKGHILGINKLLTSALLFEHKPARVLKLFELKYNLAILRLKMRTTKTLNKIIESTLLNIYPQSFFRHRRLNFPSC